MANYATLVRREDKSIVNESQTKWSFFGTHDGTSKTLAPITIPYPYLVLFDVMQSQKQPTTAIDRVSNSHVRD